MSRSNDILEGREDPIGDALHEIFSSRDNLAHAADILQALWLRDGHRKVSPVTEETPTPVLTPPDTTDREKRLAVLLCRVMKQHRKSSRLRRDIESALAEMGQ